MDPMRAQSDVELEALVSLERGLAIYGHRASGEFGEIVAGLDSRLNALRAVETQAATALDRLRDACEDCSEEWDDAPTEELANAEVQYSEIRRRLSEIEGEYLSFCGLASNFSSILGQNVPAAQSFLRAKIEQLRNYRAVQTPGAPSGAVSALAPTLPNAERKADAKLVPLDSAQIMELRGIELPPGFEWVSLSDLDLQRELEGVAGPADFKHVPYGEMRVGFERLRSQVLPLLNVTPGATSDRFRELDVNDSVPFADGLQRVFEAFFGQQDYIYFVRRPDGSLDLINGRHRVFLARELGWAAVPARVRR